MSHLSHCPPEISLYKETRMLVRKLVSTLTDLLEALWNSLLDLLRLPSWSSLHLALITWFPGAWHAAVTYGAATLCTVITSGCCMAEVSSSAAGGWGDLRHLRSREYWLYGPSGFCSGLQKNNTLWTNVFITKTKIILKWKIDGCSS